jgi:hypothetical protein
VSGVTLEGTTCVTAGDCGLSGEIPTAHCPARNPISTWFATGGANDCGGGTSCGVCTRVAAVPPRAQAFALTHLRVTPRWFADVSDRGATRLSPPFRGGDVALRLNVTMRRRCYLLLTLVALVFLAGHGAPRGATGVGVRSGRRSCRRARGR